MLAIRQENTSQNSVILMWHEPNQPNGVILEYDIKYYEKVCNWCEKRPNDSHLFRGCINVYSHVPKISAHKTAQALVRGIKVTQCLPFLPGEHKLIVFKGL